GGTWPRGSMGRRSRVAGNSATSCSISCSRTSSSRLRPRATRGRSCARFASILGEDPSAVDYGRRLDLDREVLRIRRRLEERDPGGEVNFYVPPLREIWDPPKDGGPKPPGPAPKASVSRDALDAWYHDRFGDA